MRTMIVMIAAVWATAGTASGAAADLRTNFVEADSNGDGVISRREAVATSSLVSRFSQADRNHNGLIEWQEYLQLMTPDSEQARGGWYW